MPRAKTPSTVTRKTARKPMDVAVVSDSGITRFVDPELRAALIAEAAYYRAQQRGFAPGHEVQDWLAAESDVDGRLMRAENTARRPGTTA